MRTREPEIKRVWDRVGFSPNPAQRDAILHTDGPLFLTAGPGSGKTRVLLWRALNLIAFHRVAPEEIFLGTFTEKAALQLRQGLIAYASEATRVTGQVYDLSKMLVGTVHSICRRLLGDRRFARGRTRSGHIALIDELDQHFHVLDSWKEMLEAGGFPSNGNWDINTYLTGRRTSSKHGAVAATISLFNRFSEECLDPESARRATRAPILKKLLRMYEFYLELGRTDLSLLQQAALEHCRASEGSQKVLRHIIVDEYQDTNHVQESIFFHLARGHKNLCVVGDDDQALYRFRGSTVENLVEFEARCHKHLGLRPRTLNLSTNYRSQGEIVRFYTDFIEQTDWSKGKKGSYRVQDKKSVPHRKERRPAVVASAPDTPENVCEEVAGLVKRLLRKKKVSDPNQIAFLYPSLKSKQVQRMKEALEAEGLEVYAPRAGQFLNVPEARDFFGVLMVLFGAPEGSANPGMQEFLKWVGEAHSRGKSLARKDRSLAAFLKAKQEEIQRAIADRKRLVAALGQENLDQVLTDERLRTIQSVKRLSPRAQNYARRRLRGFVESRRRTNRPLTVRYVINRLTYLDWGLLDLFYQLTQFDHFRQPFELAENHGDEGPVCNLALVTQYLERFQAREGAILSASFLEKHFVPVFFSSFLYGLWRRGESEYEDAEDPFPKGRIPFLTVHQAKGLEFPVVVLGNLRKDAQVQKVEEIVRPFLGDRQGEPLERSAEFDVARMFYVALSRPQNLLVLCHYSGRGQSMHGSFRELLDEDFPRIADLDLNQVHPAGPDHKEDLPKTYSYTGDYLNYLQCPRRYMIYRRYNFAPARAQTMFFGSLVHRTVEDLHQWLLAQAEAGRRV